MPTVKRKTIDAKTKSLCKERLDLERKHLKVFARVDEIDSKLKTVATNNGESFKEEFDKLGTIAVAGRKDKEYLGEVPEVDLEKFKALSAAEKKALVKKGIVKMVDSYAGAFYGRVTVNLF